MKNEVTIDVTAADIQGADFHSIRDCPVARAMRRTLQGGDIVIGSHMAYDERERSRCWSLPEEAIRFIGLGFHGLPVEPFSFRLQAY